MQAAGRLRCAQVGRQLAELKPIDSMRLVPAHASLAFAALVCASGTARAGGGAATDAYDGVRDDAAIDVHGLANLFVQENLNVFSATTVRLRSFDIQSGPPSVGLVHATLAHKPGIFGFRLDVGVGDMANGYLRYNPASFTHPGLSRGLSYVEQAFVTAVIPVGRGLALDVGKFGTPVGLEENESLLNWTTRAPSSSCSRSRRTTRGRGSRFRQATSSRSRRSG